MTRPSVPRSTSLTATAFEQLRHRILTCEYSPGTRLTERTLAEDLQIGLTPIREALVRLVNDGLVTVHPRRGYVITPLTRTSVRELLEMFACVCGDLAELAVENGSRDQLAAVLALIRPLSEVSDFNIPDATELFETLAIAADNQRLTDLFRQLADEAGRLFVLALRNGEVEPIDTLMDARFSRALKKRDPHTARDLVMTFHRTIGDAVIALLPSDDVQEQPSA